MVEKKNNDLQIIQLEEQVNKQQKEIQELKKLIVKIGEKITKDSQEEELKKEGEKVAGIGYWERQIISCNKNNFFVCSVCEVVPTMFHILKIRTCSADCSLVIEKIITKRLEKK